MLRLINLLNEPIISSHYLAQRLLHGLVLNISNQYHLFWIIHMPTSSNLSHVSHEIIDRQNIFFEDFRFKYF